MLPGGYGSLVAELLVEKGVHKPLIESGGRISLWNMPAPWGNFVRNMGLLPRRWLSRCAARLHQQSVVKSCPVNLQWRNAKNATIFKIKKARAFVLISIGLPIAGYRIGV